MFYQYFVFIKNTTMICLILHQFNLYVLLTCGKNLVMIKHDLVEFKVQCLKVICYHGNKSTILLFNSTTPEVSNKLYFIVEIS